MSVREVSAVAPVGLVAVRDVAASWPAGCGDMDAAYRRVLAVADAYALVAPDSCAEYVRHAVSALRAAGVEHRDLLAARARFHLAEAS